MDLRDQDPLLLPVSAVLCLSGQFPLGSDQFLKVPVICLRVLIFRSLARYSKRPDPEIDPRVLSGLRHLFRSRLFTHNGNRVRSVRFSPDRRA